MEKQRKEEEIISNQPVIFNIRYTPYALKKGASQWQIEQHRQERAFFDMSGEKNVYEYINAGYKRRGKKTETAKQYFEKNYGVFNGDGYLLPKEIEEMKKRAQDGKKNIWHGFISINQDNSYKIESPERCFKLVKRNFGQFFRDMGLDPKNVDLICALHLDREKHYHIHFAFWEKEPKCKYRKKETEYRHKGKIDQKVIDNMRVRLALYISDMTNDVYLMRDEAIRRLRKMTALEKFMYSDEKIKKEFISLCKDLPATIPLEYNRKEMELFRKRIDKIATMLFMRDREALKADERVYEKIDEVRHQVKEICDGSSENEKYHFRINPETITLVDKLEEDYKRRVGNIILHAVKFIKPEYFERNQKRKYKVNDNKLKRRLAISERKVGKRFDRFFLTFGQDCQILERDFTNRLHEIEEELEEKKKQEEWQNEQEEIKRSKYYWSK